MDFSLGSPSPPGFTSPRKRIKVARISLESAFTGSPQRLANTLPTSGLSFPRQTPLPSPTDSLDTPAHDPTSSSNMESTSSDPFSDLFRSSSSGTNAWPSSFEHPSSEADVYSDEDINVTLSNPFEDDGAEPSNPLSKQSATVVMRQQRSSSRSRKSSSEWTTSSVPEDDVEAGYEADSDTRTTSSRRRARGIRTRSRRASAHVHYLVERVEPTIEVLAPLTTEELVYLKAHTNIPIPAHHQHLLPGNADEAPGTPSTTSSSTSEIFTPSDEMGLDCVVGRAQSVTAHSVTELERRPQSESPASPDHPADIDLGDHPHIFHLRDLPPTPDLRPWLAVASGEPSPMVLASPAAPRVIHGPRPRLVRTGNRR